MVQEDVIRFSKKNYLKINRNYAQTNKLTNIQFSVSFLSVNHILSYCVHQSHRGSLRVHVAVNVCSCFPYHSFVLLLFLLQNLFLLGATAIEDKLQEVRE